MVDFNKHLKLKNAERVLAKHVEDGHGKETEKSLHAKANDADLDARELFDNHEHVMARHYQNKADHLDQARTDLKHATQLVKQYGSGHDMTHHGEGKPHGT